MSKPYETDELAGVPGQDDTIPTLDQLPPGTTRFIDVTIYDLPAPEGEDAPTVESRTTARSEPLVSQDQHDDDGDQEHVPPLATPPVRSPHRRRRPPYLALFALGVCMGSVLVLVVYLVFPFVGPSATVTIVPVSKQVRMSTTITIVTSGAAGADPAQGQVPGRVLSSVTMSQQVSTPTTGVAHQEAQVARGLVTFYNGALYSQVVTAGTLLTGADGIQIVTEGDAVIPAGNLATNGQATVAAHAVVAGPNGNIKAGDVYGPCCRLNVYAANGAFSGGQNARTYQTVAQGDLDAAGKSVKTSLDQSMQAAFQAQVHADEMLLLPLECRTTTTADHKSGEEAARVQVTMALTCQGLVYQTQAAQEMFTHLLGQEADKQIGDGYQPQDNPQVQVVSTTAQAKGAMQVHVMLNGNYGYQFTTAQQTQMKALIAGKDKAEAITALLKVPGVQSVSISVSDGGTALPTNVDHVHLAFLVMGA